MNPLNVAQIEREIESLLASYPELADDESLRAELIEGSTDATMILSKIVDRMQDAETMAEAIKSRVAGLELRQQSFNRRGDAMRALALRIMNAATLRKMVLPEVTLSIRSNPPSLVFYDEEQIPDEFTKTEIRIDRAKIKDALKAGATVPGAHLSNGSESLSVRSK